MWLALPPSGTASGVLYAGIVFTEAFMGCVQGLNAAWLSVNMEERQRPLALGCYVMSIQLASFVGSNVFEPGDAPRYTRGLLICAGCVLGGAVVCVVWGLLYRFVEDKHDDQSTISGVSVEEIKEQPLSA